jgi:pyruvate,water dikinase
MPITPGEDRVTRTVLLDWLQAAIAGPSICGGKGWTLGRLHRYGFRVPAGGVLAAEVYRQFMATPALQSWQAELADISAEEVVEPTVDQALTAMRAAIVGVALPADVATEVSSFLTTANLDGVPIAVRSSATAEDGATASFAGIHSSVLNVRGTDAVLHAIKECYASLWTPQALAYRRRLDLTDEQVACAVVLCAMVPAVAAGVAFSCDPRTGRRDLVTINAVHGLGDALVSGRVNPEEISVSLAEGLLTVAERRGPAVLTDAQVLEMSRLVLRAHWAFGEGQDPQDVEWAYDGKRFWLLQVRPVTRLPHWTFPGVADQPVMWSNANVKDVIPGIPSMLGWNIVLVAIPMLLFGLVEVTGYPPPPGLEIVRRFSGRAYFDLTAIQWLYYDGFGVLPAETNRLLGGRQPEITVPTVHARLGWAGLRRGLRCLRLLRALLPIPRQMPREMARYFAVARGLKAIDRSRLSNVELADLLQRVSRESAPFAPRFCLASAAAGVWAAVLQSLLERLFPGRGMAVLNALSAGCGGVTSAEHGYRLEELAAAARDDADARAYLADANADPHGWRRLPAGSLFRSALERFLADFGHRALYEAEIANPRWNDDPSFLLDEVRRRLEGDPLPDRRAAARATREAAEAELRRRTWLLRPLLFALLKRHRQGGALREAAKSTIVALFEPVRLVGLEIGRRLVAAGRLDRPEQIFDLSYPDLEAYLLGEWDGHGARERSDDVRARTAAWMKETPPEVIIVGAQGTGNREQGTGVRGQESGTERDGRELRGVGVAAGCAAGVARIIHHPREARRFQNGEVLVAPSTDPGWTPLFLRAAAVVMETGGYLSHGAIVAREYGIPAVVNVPGLLDRVRDGQRLTVDGDAGRITLDV